MIFSRFFNVFSFVQFNKKTHSHCNNKHTEAQPPNELVKKLLVEQRVEIVRYRARTTNEPDLAQLRRAIDLRLVLVKFTETRGGTELGANLRSDDGALAPDSVAWNDNTLTVRGRLKLDYTPVQLDATIDLKSFVGHGKLTVIPDFEIKRD